MKIKFFLFLVVFFCFISCRYDNDLGSVASNPPMIVRDTEYDYSFNLVTYEPGLLNTGFAAGTVFGKTWKATPLAFRKNPQSDSSFILYFTTFSKEGFRREQLSFWKFKNPALGSYPIKYDGGYVDSIITAFYSINQDDGDVQYAGFKLDTNRTNSINILNNDQINKILKGKFTCYFKKKYGPADVPDRMLFKDIEFELSYK